ncbi:hypothetical protein EJ903_24680 [Azospirillum griseum]|uniref:Uncharacterized protein n=1 Tax=Azospirillum griseum TaxID=2496639 RepID=A0A431VA43_9PROT|nr:hypothetical protein EJ903_24680 [Azospirillum griseum]
MWCVGEKQKGCKQRCRVARARGGKCRWGLLKARWTPINLANHSCLA